MAHSARKKATALAMLMTGESVTATAAATGIPKQTISRWKHADLPQLLQPIAAAHPELVRWGRALRAVSLSHQNGTKKRKVVASGSTVAPMGR